MLLISIYLVTGEGPTGENIDILKKVSTIIQAKGLDWILAGDFNFSPELLHSTGWLAQAKGVVVHQEGLVSTCRKSKQILDYFVVSKRLGPAMAASGARQDTPWKPHLAIGAQLHRKPRNLKKLGLAGPKKLPENSSKAKEEVNNDLVEQGLASCSKTWDGKLTDGLLHKHLQLHPRQKEIMELGRFRPEGRSEALPGCRHTPPRPQQAPGQGQSADLQGGKHPDDHSGRKARKRLYSHLGHHSS